MSEAEAILWFAMTALFGGSVCYVVRGLLGEPVRVSTHGRGAGAESKTRRITWPLIGLGAGMFVLSIASLWGALVLRAWLAFTSGGADRLSVAVTSGLALPCVVLLGLGAAGDRSKGRKRCPSCWYDMSAGGDRCPECGREIARRGDLLRTRRRAWPFVMASLFVLAGVYAFTHTTRIQRSGWLGGVPTTVLAIGWSWLPERVILDWSADGSLVERISVEDSDPIGLWGSTSRALAAPGSIQTLRRAAVLRGMIVENRLSLDEDLSERELELPRRAQLTLGSWVLATRPSNPAEEETLGVIASWHARIDQTQRDDTLRRIAHGEDLNGAVIAVLTKSVSLALEEAEPLPDLSLVLDAAEGQSFSASDGRPRRLASIMMTVAGDDPDAIDRVYGTLESDSPSARYTALHALLLLNLRDNWNNPLPVRLLAAFGRAVRDPDPDVMAFAGQILMRRSAHDEDAVREIVRVIRSTAPGREGLVPTGITVPHAIDEAVTDAIADPDPVMAERAAVYLHFRLYERDEHAAGLASRARALLKAGALGDSMFDEARSLLERAIDAALEGDTAD